MFLSMCVCVGLCVSGDAMCLSLCIECVCAVCLCVWCILRLSVYNVYVCLSVGRSVCMHVVCVFVCI